MDYCLEKKEEIDNKMRLVDSEIYLLKRKILDKEKQIGELVPKIKSLEMDIQQKATLHSHLARLKESNESKLSAYMQLSDKSKRLTTEFKEIETLKNQVSNKEKEVQEAQRQYDAKRSGAVSCETGQNPQLKKKAELMAAISEIKQKIDVCKSKEAKLKMNITVLKKRNAAQHLRLHRSIKEAQLRKTHWQSQVENMKQKIEQLKERNGVR